MKLNDLQTTAQQHRHPDYAINDLILTRWSPRAMTGQELEHDQLMSLFEAARWAPSSYNSQPWRFIYSTPSDTSWDTFVGFLDDWNSKWATQASALVVVVAKTTFDYNGKPSSTAEFDTGSAWENLALQAMSQGLVAHGMVGFDHDQAAKKLKLPKDHKVLAMIAIGQPGKKTKLPQDIQERETPSDRRPLDEIVMKGKFQSPADYA